MFVCVSMSFVNNLFFLDWPKSCYWLWRLLLLVDWKCLAESETFVFLKKTVLVQGLKLILGRLLERFGPLGDDNDDLSVTLCVWVDAAALFPTAKVNGKMGPVFRRSGSTTCHLLQWSVAYDTVTRTWHVAGIANIHILVDVIRNYYLTAGFMANTSNAVRPEQDC